MPSMNQAQLAAAHSLGQANIDIKDNAALSANPEAHKGYVYLAKLDTTNSGHAFPDVEIRGERGETEEAREEREAILKELNSLDVVLAPRTKAVIFNQLAIDQQLHSHQSAQGVGYLTVNDVVNGLSSTLPKYARIIRVMTPLILQQYDKTYVALTRRGKGATHEGLLGCPSQLLGRPLTSEFLKAVASEFLLTVNGNPFSETEIRLPKIPHTVSVHGGHANTEFKCFSVDKPEEHTLTWVFPMFGRLPEGHADVQNIEHPGDETKLVEISNLYKAPQNKDYSLMAGLKEYLLGA